MVAAFDETLTGLIDSLGLVAAGPPHADGACTIAPVRAEDQQDPVILRVWHPGRTTVLPIIDKLRKNSALDQYSGVAAPIKFGCSDDLLMAWGLYNTFDYSPISPALKPEIILSCLGEAGMALQRAGYHGNLKPGNLLVSSKERQPLLMDFGRPKATAAELLGERNPTLFFQPQYLASDEPRSGYDENFGWAESRDSGDAFALAALCIHLLSGKYPAWTELITNAAEAKNSSSWESLLPHGLSAVLTAALKSGLAAERNGRRALTDLAEGIRSSPEARLTEAKKRRLKQRGWTIEVSNTQKQDSDEIIVNESEKQKDDDESARWDLNLLLPAGRTAAEIRKALDRLVIGQDSPKKEFSVLLSMHLTWFEEQNRLHKPPNAVLVGSTGVGKTHTLRTAAEYLQIPYTIIDATSLVPSGIVGYQIEDAIADLVASAESILVKSKRDRFDNDSLELAQRGIIFVDEFDKLVRSPDGRDDWGKEQVQRRLLKAIEGAMISVGVSHSYYTEQRRSLDTSGLLFIASGAFQGIDSPKIRSQRPDRLQRVLRTTEGIISADLITYGFLPELIARLQTIIRFVELTTEQLETILRSPEVTPIAVWQNHFKRLGKDLVITDEALRAVAMSAADLELGARGLQQILFPLLSRVAYDLETSADREYVLKEQDVLQGRRREGG